MFRAVPREEPGRDGSVMTFMAEARCWVLMAASEGALERGRREVEKNLGRGVPVGPGPRPIEYALEGCREVVDAMMWGWDGTESLRTTPVSTLL